MRRATGNDAWDQEGYCPFPQVDYAPRVRISALLGPDGEPLMVPYERPAVGFDLRPKRKRQEAKGR